jgi:hypothetical protein
MTPWADLRIGLAEMKEILAEAIEHVALGDPGRLTHHSRRSPTTSMSRMNGCVESLEGGGFHCLTERLML